MKTIQVRVKPGSRTSCLHEPEGEGATEWVALIKSPPVDGKANAELVALVAKRFACGKAAVAIKSGASGRLKLVQIEVVE